MHGKVEETPTFVGKVQNTPHVIVVYIILFFTCPFLFFIFIFSIYGLVFLF